MSDITDITDIDASTGLLNRQAFLREARQVQENLPARVCRGCLLIMRFPQLLNFSDHDDEAALNDAMKHLLAVVETRSRSRDVLGRISADSLCLLLKQCKEADAVIVADQYAALLSDVVLEISGVSQRLNLKYRIVPLDLVGSRIKQGISRAIHAPPSSISGHLQGKEKLSVKQERAVQDSKIVSLNNRLQIAPDQAREIGRVVRLPSAKSSSITS